jgi:hypothetical protein
VKLTATNVARKTAKAGVYKDDDLAGFYLRSAERGKTFKLRLEVCAGGKSDERGWTIGKAIEAGPAISGEEALALADTIISGGKGGSITADNARRVAKAIRDRRDEGKISLRSSGAPALVADPGMITLSQVREDYRVVQKNEGASPDTVRFYDDIFKLFFEKRTYEGTSLSWADTPLKNITRTAVKKLHDDVTTTPMKHGKGRPYRANQILRAGNALHTFARKGLRTPGLDPESPFQSYRLANKETPRKRGIGLRALPEWHAKVEKLPPLRRALNEFYLLSALREETVLTMRRTQVHLNERVIDIPRPKGGEDRAFRLPISEAMVRCLARAYDAAVLVDDKLALEWVWPSATSESGHIEESKEVSRWKRKDGTVVIVRKVDKSPHALRASWRTIAGDLGIDSDHRHVIMNHKLPRGAHNDYASPEEWTKLVDSMEKVSSAIVDAIGRGKL